MMKITLPLASLAVLLLNSSMATAQSTFNDPVPLSGNAAENTARITSINSAIENSGKASKRSPAEQLRRQAALKQSAACEKEARLQYPAGDKRRYELTAQCDRNFKQQKATWR